MIFFFVFFFFVLWIMPTFAAHSLHTRLQKAEALAQWAKYLWQDPSCFSNHLETWNNELLDKLKQMRRNQWISKEEFRAMRKELSNRYDYIKVWEPIDTSGASHVQHAQGGRS